MSGKTFIIVGALAAAIAVGLGAMGAHLLKDKLTAEQLANFETAVRYQMYHAVALVLVGLAARGGSSTLLNVSGCLFLAGIALFSGGLYGWIFTAIKPFVHIVPIGGSLWIVAWVSFAIAAWRK